MPADGRRFVQRVDGYVATLVAGQPIFLVRAGRNGVG